MRLFTITVNTAIAPFTPLTPNASSLQFTIRFAIHYSVIATTIATINDIIALGIFFSLIETSAIWFWDTNTVLEKIFVSTETTSDLSILIATFWHASSFLREFNACSRTEINAISCYQSLVPKATFCWTAWFFIAQLCLQFFSLTFFTSIFSTTTVTCSCSTSTVTRLIARWPCTPWQPLVIQWTGHYMARFNIFEFDIFTIFDFSIINRNFSTFDSNSNATRKGTFWPIWPWRHQTFVTIFLIRSIITICHSVTHSTVFNALVSIGTSELVFFTCHRIISVIINFIGWRCGNV